MGSEVKLFVITFKQIFWKQKILMSINCFCVFLPFPVIPGTPFQIRGTEVHSLPVTLCMCASGAIFLILEENSYCVAPQRSPSLGCLAFCMFFFKALFRDRGTEGLGAPVQMGFVSLLCCLVSPSHTRGTAQFLAAPDA